MFRSTSHPSAARHSVETLDRVALFFFVCGALLVSNPAFAQFPQQGPKLVAMGTVGSAGQGLSVSLSADGNTAIVGGLLDGNITGGAWIWTRSGATWTQGSKLTCSGVVNFNQGVSVSLSGDGNTALVGTLGAVCAWARSGGAWVQQGPALFGSGAEGNAGQGKSVSLSADGSTAIVGGPDDHNQAGAVWIFTRSGGVWAQQGPKLVGSGVVNVPQGALFGASVSLSADGNTAIVGGPNDNNYAGAAWILMRTGGAWFQQGNKKVGSGASGNTYQGDSVAISADGNTALIGGPGDSGNIGAVWIWTKNSGVWIQQGTKLFASDSFGSAEQGLNYSSLSADGNTALVGGPADNGQAGAAWVWKRSGGVWSQLGTKLFGSGAAGLAAQGISVSLSADGSTAIVGGPYDNSNTGAVWIFSASGGTPGSCIYSISSSGQNFGSSGGTGSVTVTGTPNGCTGNWTAASNDTFITVTSGSSGSGSGPGTVNYSVSSNGSTSPRSGTITIATKTFTVSQSGAGGLCVPGNTTLCLNGGRFKVQAQWATLNGSSGPGQAVALTSDTGYFWFFSANNVEMLIKVVDGRAVNSRFWVFAGGLTDVSVAMTVTDTQSGTVKNYTNPQGTAFQPIQDTNAFASTTTDPDLSSTSRALYPSAISEHAYQESAQSCAANATTLCLNNGRFRVQTQWTTPQGQSGAGQAVGLTSDTGYFWFFSSNNVEMLVKAVTGCPVNSQYWVFAGGLTNVNVVMTVTDTQTGAIKTYTNPQGTAFAPTQDTSAFGCP